MKTHHKDAQSDDDIDLSFITPAAAASEPQPKDDSNLTESDDEAPVRPLSNSAQSSESEEEEKEKEKEKDQTAALHAENARLKRQIAEQKRRLEDQAFQARIAGILSDRRINSDEKTRQISQLTEERARKTANEIKAAQDADANAEAKEQKSIDPTARAQELGAIQRNVWNRIHYLRQAALKRNQEEIAHWEKTNPGKSFGLNAGGFTITTLTMMLVLFLATGSPMGIGFFFLLLAASALYYVLSKTLGPTIKAALFGFKAETKTGQKSEQEMLDNMDRALANEWNRDGYLKKGTLQINNKEWKPGPQWTEERGTQESLPPNRASSAQEQSRIHQFDNLGLNP